MLNLNFVWDKHKAKSNLIKHKVSFEEAGSLFKYDTNLLTIFDSKHSINEERWISVGISLNGILI